MLRNGSSKGARNYRRSGPGPCNSRDRVDVSGSSLGGLCDKQLGARWEATKSLVASQTRPHGLLTNIQDTVSCDPYQSEFPNAQAIFMESKLAPQALRL